MIGLCQCGCGGRTSVAKKTDAALGSVKGEHRRFMPGHHTPVSFEQTLDRTVPSREPGQCWEWQGKVGTSGYGQLSRKIDGRKRTFMAHRVAYETWAGPIPDGLVLDHLCRNTRCVNPEHLEPVTHRENCYRGVAPAIQIFHSNRCGAGHEFTPENTYVTKRGRRDCRTCHARRQRERDARARAAKEASA